MKQIKDLLSETSGLNLIYHDCFDGNPKIYCRVCSEAVSGFSYIDITNSRSDRRYGLHKSCAESPCEIQHHLHPQHPLTAFYKEGLHFTCDGCRHFSFRVASYHCVDCNFKLYFQCVSNPRILTLTEKLEISSEIHSQHNLQLIFCNRPFSIQFINRFKCCYCLEDFQSSALVCFTCQLFIHEFCLGKVPYQVSTPFHHKHPLLLSDSAGYLSCEVCSDKLWGLMLSCSDCLCNFHISCCYNTASFLTLNYHKEHPMVYINKPLRSYDQKRKCVVCNTDSEWGVYGCLDCKVYVHVECIPLPRVVKNEYHSDHPLTLELSHRIQKRNAGNRTYYCLICEEKGYVNFPYYWCEECCDMAHVHCVMLEVNNLQYSVYSFKLSFTVFNLQSLTGCSNRSDRILSSKESRAIYIRRTLA